VLTKIEEDLREQYDTPGSAHEFKASQTLSSQLKDSKEKDF